MATSLATLSDRYADHLFAAGAQEQVANIGCGRISFGESFLILIIAFLLLIAGIIHTILLFIRLGVMVVLLGTLPMAAAASMTDWGSGWWRKHIGWMVAWLIYKPAAALILFAGSAMLSSSTGDVQTRIAGLGVMLLSAIALPALLKLVVPATAALGGGNLVGQGTMAVAGGLASGAKSLGTAALSSQGGGGGSAAGPSGASGGPGAAGAAGRAGGAGEAGGAGAAGAGRAGAAGAAGASGAAAAAGPAGAVLGAAAQVVSGAGKIAAGSLDGADGNAGHNR
ncbi:hypothetical protein ACFWNK_35665 [Streptomyces sp. NPDC058417]|uniref:hypothetical protein n=1 Tax=unclassified Streptomyces TaxID=2593676 RepID=UPI00365DE1EE